MKNKGYLSIVCLVSLLFIFAFLEIVLTKCYLGYQAYDNIQTFNTKFEKEKKVVKDFKLYLKNNELVSEEFEIDGIFFKYNEINDKLYYCIDDIQFVMIIDNKKIIDYYIVE